jgi:hypothetical protein
MAKGSYIAFIDVLWQVPKSAYLGNGIAMIGAW